jgi:hypothetical protein
MTSEHTKCYRVLVHESVLRVNLDVADNVGSIGSCCMLFWFGEKIEPPASALFVCSCRPVPVGRRVLGLVFTDRGGGPFF